MPILLTILPGILREKLIFLRYNPDTSNLPHRRAQPREARSNLSRERPGSFRGGSVVLFAREKSENMGALAENETENSSEKSDRNLRAPIGSDPGNYNQLVRKRGGAAEYVKVSPPLLALKRRRRSERLPVLPMVPLLRRRPARSAITRRYDPWSRGRRERGIFHTGLFAAR